jgi:hypothetical protein
MPEPTESFIQTETQPQQSTEKKEKKNLLNKILGLDKEVDEGKRKFLQLAGLTGIALVLSACNADDIFSIEDDNLSKNIEELNKQFGEIENQYLDGEGYFNYERFKIHPEFDKYIKEIHTNSARLGEETGIKPNALRLITSSIIAANLGNWEGVSLDTHLEDVKNTRIGPMQFYPQNVLDALKDELNTDYKYSAVELERTFNIYIGSRYFVHTCLGEVENNGTNQNILALTLAQYYGGKNLVSYIKNNKEVPQEDFLRENYDLYMKTMNTMGINTTFAKSPEVGGVETEMDVVWEKALHYWPDSNLKHAKPYFYEQAELYFNDDANKILKLSKREYLALFVSISMAESAGGVEEFLGPHPISGARGWFQVIPEFHLKDYYEQVQKSQGQMYTKEQLRNDPEISIKVGAWALMRYRNSEGYQDIKELMKYFKAGAMFEQNWESGLWWNRITYCVTNLLGQDSLRLGYMDYQYPEGTYFKAEEFLTNGEDHIGERIYIDPSGDN